MTDLRKAAEQALEMFDWLERRSMYQDLQMEETHEALRKALEQPEQWKTCRHCGFDYKPPKADKWFPLAQPEQEPVCFLRETSWSYEIAAWNDPRGFPVYSAPPQKEWVGLTADEIWKCNKAEDGSSVEFHICSAHQNVLDFAEVIEAKLKDKNNADA